jgi:streptomycin 6-kinase
VKTDLGPPLGAGKEAETYAYRPGWVVKLTRWRRDHAPARREDAILRALASTGLAPASGGVVEIDGRWGVVMERAPDPVLADRLATPNGPAEVLEIMLALHRKMHAQPAPSGLFPLKDRLVRNITGARLLDEPTRRRLLDSLPDLPDGDRLCHGDFHPYNIMGEGDGIRIVDWADAHAGDPAADVCRTFVLIGSVLPEMAERYVADYCAATGVDRMAVHAWLPVVAGARLAEKVPEETDRLLALARGRKLR